MDLLLDTHALVWFLNGDGKLSDKVKVAIENPNNRKTKIFNSIIFKPYGEWNLIRYRLNQMDGYSKFATFVHNK